MIYDISMMIEEDMQVYKNRETKKPKFNNVANFNNSPVYETQLELNLHTGTHIDYPLHVFENGKTTQSENLDALIGPCKVFDLSKVEDKIKLDDIIDYDIQENDFILFKTKNSNEDKFKFDFIYLAEDAAKYLKEKKISGVGIDSLGIERSQQGHPTHKHLLGNDIIILEGLRLKDIKEDQYQLICLPLKIKNVEASLARAILIK